MNATTIQQPADTATLQTSKGAQVIAIDADGEIEKRACGRIVMWSLQGDVGVETLKTALKTAGSPAIPPEEPSALVALHRAVDATARILGHLDVHHKGRGEWAIVSKPSETEAPDGQKSLVYPIACTAKVVREKGGAETLTIDGQGADQIRAAYEAAKHTLAPADVGTWLCDKLAALRALRLRDSGGVYFLPQQSVRSWTRVTQALAACSKHRLHTIPAMKSADAAEAILASLAELTREACDKISADIADGTLGEKALANRDAETRALLARVELYEGLLGGKLDDLRVICDETRAAVATAALASSSGS